MKTIPNMCTGCMACMNVCPVSAIYQIIDEYGFISIKINKNKCTNCGLCEKVCPINNNKKNIYKSEPLEAYGLYNKSEDIVKISSSGGAYYTLAKKVVNNGGIAFGCYFDIKSKIAYLENTDNIPLEKLLTSKYVESNIKYGFNEVKKQLETGRKVLFCGTPCQVAGLSNFLGKEYDNLLLVDFTCGAVSSQSVLNNYLTSLEKKYKSKIADFSFRDKHYGWGQYCLYVKFENGKIYRKTAMSDPYFFCFLRSSMQRLSCHGCGFSDKHRSDIVLADFWRVNQFDIDNNGKKGISLVLCLSQKGVNAISDIKEDLIAHKVDLKSASYNLKERKFIEGKLPEIREDQMQAYLEGVVKLRKRLLKPTVRLKYAFRQWIMDHPKLASKFPKLVGNGQIIK